MIVVNEAMGDELPWLVLRSLFFFLCFAPEKSRSLPGLFFEKHAERTYALKTYFLANFLNGFIER